MTGSAVRSAGPASQIVESAAYSEWLMGLLACWQVREVVSDFYGARYASCLARLTKLTPLLRLDLMLGAHVTQLTDAIRSKAIVQYTQPFQTVHLPTMATAFSMHLTYVPYMLSLAWFLLTRFMH